MIKHKDTIDDRFSKKTNTKTKTNIHEGENVQQ